MGVEGTKTKRTSRSQQVFHMCSVNQGMLGFGGRSCRDNEKVSVINLGEKNSKKEIFKLVCWLSKFKLCDVFRGIVLFLFPHIMRPTSVLHVSNKACILFLACKQALQGALVAGWEKEGELATTSLEFEFHLQFPCGSPSTKMSDFRQSARRRNERECKQTLKNTCQGSWRHYWYRLRQSAFRIVFRCRYSNSRDAVASSPSFSRPTARAPPRACSHANSLCTSTAKSKTAGTIVEK